MQWNNWEDDLLASRSKDAVLRRTKVFVREGRCTKVSKGFVNKDIPPTIPGVCGFFGAGWRVTGSVGPALIGCCELVFQLRRFALFGEEVVQVATAVKDRSIAIVGMGLRR